MEYHFFYKKDSFIVDNQITDFLNILIGSSKSHKILLSKNDISKNKTFEQLMNMINLRLKLHKE